MLIQCAFAKSVWFEVLLRKRLHHFTPTGNDALQDSWPTLVAQLQPTDRSACSTLIIATLRFIWLERNARVFKHKSSTAAVVSASIGAEFALWAKARNDREYTE